MIAGLPRVQSELPPLIFRRGSDCRGVNERTGSELELVRIVFDDDRRGGERADRWASQGADSAPVSRAHASDRWGSREFRVAQSAGCYKLGH